MDGWRRIPSINELRYVGYHVFKACGKSDDPIKQREELRRAESHCKRASFDAMELGIITQLENVLEFKNNYSDYPVSDVMPDYIDLMTEVANTQKYLAAMKKGVEEREQFYLECEPRLDRLIEINEKLFQAQNELGIMRAASINLELRAKRAELIAAVSVILAFCMFVYTILSPGQSQAPQTQASGQSNGAAGKAQLNQDVAGTRP